MLISPFDGCYCITFFYFTVLYLFSENGMKVFASDNILYMINHLSFTPH